MTPRPRNDWILDGQYQRRVVDGLRAIGIVLVVAFHTAFLLTKAVPKEQLEGFISGFPGVLNIVWQALGSEMVFFSSGFLLSYLLLREKLRFGSIDLRGYLIRRISRILPLFLIALGLFMIGRNFYLDRFVLNLLFVARLFGEKNYIPVGWSLEVMMQVYLLLPFLIGGFLATRKPLTVALICCVASVVPRWIALTADPAAYTTGYYELVFGADAPEVQKDLYYLTWYRLTPFLMGIAVALLVTVHRERTERWCASPTRASASLLAGGGLLMAVGWLPLHRPDGFVYDLFGPGAWQLFWTLQRPLLSLAMGLLLVPVLFAPRGLPGLAGRLLALRMWAPVSQGIYSIYLFLFACLVPAALIVFAPAVISTLLSAESFDRKDLLAELSLHLGSVTIWHYLIIVILATWASTRLASFMTRTVERPIQALLRKRFGREPRR
jgi:peptidoglycan/LPS O-acetylase OafA/YrhL